MELNYEKRYAYSEVEVILDWLGESYINKVPKRILRTIKEEKKFGYIPEIDFTKSIENQIRQETKNMIAYLKWKVQYFLYFRYLNFNLTLQFR